MLEIDGSRYSGSGTIVRQAVALASSPVAIELRGGLFQGFAPSFYYLEHVLLPMCKRMGFEVSARMERPGYVPSGQGICYLNATPARGTLRPLVFEAPGKVEKIWGIALSSRLKAQAVSERMADAATRALEAAGYHADIQARCEDSALQAVAGLAVFAELSGGARIGSDRAGAKPTLGSDRQICRAPAAGRFKDRRNPRSLRERPNYSTGRAGRR